MKQMTDEQRMKAIFDRWASLLARLAALSLAVALGAGCGLKIRIPQPGPPPVETPSPVCEAGQVECYHNPGSGWVWACATGENVQGPEQCPGAPPVEPKPFAGAILPGANYELLTRTVSPYNDAINAAMKAVSGCDSQNCRVASDQFGAAAFRDKVALKLRESGICAGTQEATNDAPLAVAAWDGSACAEDEWTHPVVEFGGFQARWQPTANDPPDHWRRVSAAPPEPPVEPVPLPGECPPLKEIGVKVVMYAQRSIDATPWTGPREVCDALGFQNRGSCPFGVEIEGQHNPEKIRCEAFYGPYTCEVNGLDCGRFNDNPLQWSAAAPGHYEVCSRTNVCNSVDLQ